LSFPWKWPAASVVKMVSTPMALARSTATRAEAMGLPAGSVTVPERATTVRFSARARVVAMIEATSPRSRPTMKSRASSAEPEGAMSSAPARGPASGWNQASSP
jgi:hypothetical protein